MSITINGKEYAITLPVAFKATLSLAYGGACGAVADFFAQGSNINTLDWHKVGWLALGGAIGSIIQHGRKSLFSN
jgi:hypothetical protein